MTAKKKDDTANCKSSAVPILMECLLEKGYGTVVRLTMEWTNE
jgi:hypothetical protein